METVKLDPNQWYAAQLGPLTLWLCRREEELLWASQQATEEECGDHALSLAASKEGPPSDLNQDRLLPASALDAIGLHCALPPRSVVVRPAAPITLAPGAAARFFVTVPLWLRIAPATDTTQTYCEEATVSLSNTWFGTPERGELCYSLRSRARRKLEDHNRCSYRAVVPMQLENRSDKALPFERFCLRVPHLTLYTGATRFWTNEVTCTCSDDEQWEKIVYASSPPSLEEDLKEAAPPREPAAASFLDRSLQSMRSLW